MKNFRWFPLALAAILFAGCSQSNGFNPFQPTPTLPPPIVTIVSVPDASEVADAYLEAYRAEDYAAMYTLLSESSRNDTTQEDFAARHREALTTMSVNGIEIEILDTATSPTLAQTPFHLTYKTALAGVLERDMTLPLVLENGQWRVQWDPGLILPELAGGNRLAMDCRSPDRGEIFDRDGEGIVTRTEAVALGIIPGQIGENTYFTLLNELWRLTGVTPETIEDKIAVAAPEWYIPIGTTSTEEGERLLDMGLTGLVTNPYSSRYYANAGLAPQAVGYTLGISAEDLEAYKRRGYCGDEKVGAAGVELAAEDALAGQHGGRLYVIGPNGQIVANLAETPLQPSSSVYLTVDKNLQFYAQQAIAGFTGAVVVLERDTGRVLAMASSPEYDPNLFDPDNYNFPYLLGDVINDPDNPLLNRATQGQYPLGSVFKIITMSAAMESGLYAPETTYDCQYDFTEIPGVVLHDWTWDHCQDRLQAGQECNTSDSTPSGALTLKEGLMRSCNPYFWHIGLDLFNHERAGDIARMARAFGLGSPTGIEIPEEPGQILEPGGALEATNQAIGQGDVLVTPIQVAAFVSAIGNGGTLYRPQIIEKIQRPDGTTEDVFAPEARGVLPLLPERLKAVQEAMFSVINDPRGTAAFRLRNLNIPSAGKTGTAETGSDEPHAWFVAYTDAAENTGLPDIAVAIILENAGEGSDYAAPVFQRITEIYYQGSPQTLYWWESAFGVTKTPTPFGGIPTKTPRP